MKMKSPRKSARFVEPPPAPTEQPGPALSLPDPALPLHESPPALHKVDGRSRRATGRTTAFATRVSDAWKQKLHRLADEMGLLYTEVLERALDALDRELQAKR